MIGRPASGRKRIPTKEVAMRLVQWCALAIVALCSGGVDAATAYASNEGSGSVSVIDTATDRVTATITTGGKPRGIAISLDGSKLYVSDQEANALVVVDTAQKKQIAKVPLGQSPEAI